MLGLFVAGLVFLVVGLLGIGFGFPVKEFSFGNTLIVTGALAACTGALLIAIGLVVRELRAVAEVLASAPHLDGRQADPLAAPALPPVPTRPAVEARVPEPAARASDAPPWHNERPGRERLPSAVESEPEPAAEPAPPPAQEPVRKRRNLLFTSTRREREASEAAAAEAGSASPAAPAGDEPHPSFDDAWPASERGRPPRQNPRETADVRPPPPPIRRPSEAPSVSILKSGVVDGMAYSLYSDGSIEAQMPEGMVRFSSIDELRKHLEQRGG
ncbi:DUF308 domain-containing protein [Bradyrhizobium sp. U87765 SZCCT0131]|nr:MULTISPECIES: DUF308 domain-containing protein [unclassified Bradyrhizobium]MBR1222640.1 DUF308 domain-containing protein [Bradyrhizobium sp. U87765 SZCCT0131]MBR1265279.1 DUF308 domain-containing protein [Bradyrhizobium sp. U87765 SZCCT0134]MBR1302942.1 DUF308 domain-containing protein [Bradyrhizobium sp. U87765 SZCCT0110]MBR1323640.1 DUF308 domain-containing protein [Bradyrhizobium sp. U87765 SZCCT0109]MBR1346871.1 DUF308 domain-containing protein [Bradyrhizobium sp. U87765 SZCCT0048]